MTFRYNSGLEHLEPNLSIFSCDSEGLQMSSDFNYHSPFPEAIIALTLTQQVVVLIGAGQKHQQKLGSTCQSTEIPTKVPMVKTRSFPMS